MTLRDTSQDEARLANLLATLNATVGPPDEAVLAGLRVEAGAAFATTPGQSQQEEVHSKAPGTWRRKMLCSGMVAAAAVILLGLSFVAWLKPVSGPSLAEIFAQVEARDAFAATYRQRQTEQRLNFARPAILRLESAEHLEHNMLISNGQAWAVDEARNQGTPAEAQHIFFATAVLQGRKSLGWRDLKSALAAAIKQAGPSTPIVYLGDGTPATALRRNPQIFVGRFKTILQRDREVHAIVLGSPVSPSGPVDLGPFDKRRIPSDENVEWFQMDLQEIGSGVDQADSDESRAWLQKIPITDFGSIMDERLLERESLRDRGFWHQGMAKAPASIVFFTNEFHVLTADRLFSLAQLRQAPRLRRSWWARRFVAARIASNHPVISLVYQPPQFKLPVWPPETIEIVQSLNRRPALEKLKHTHLVLDRVTESYDPRRNQLSSQTKRVEYVSGQRWLVRQEGDGTSTTVEWCDEKERGLLNLTFLTARTRPSTVAERRQPPLALPDHSLEDLSAHYGQWQAKFDHLDGQRVRVMLRHAETKTELRWDIDTARHVLLREETSIYGKLQSSAVHAEFQNVAGLWWAGRVSQFDGRGKLTTQTIQQVQSVGAELLQGRWTQELKEKPNCLILPQPPLIPIDPAKKGAAGGKESRIDHIVLMAQFTQSQQRTRMKEHVAQVERLTGD